MILSSDAELSYFDSNPRVKTTLEDPQLSKILPAPRQRPASAGRHRPLSAGRQQPNTHRLERPRSANQDRSSLNAQGRSREKVATWPQAPRFGKASNLDETQVPRPPEAHTLGKALSFRPRYRSDDQRWQWEQWSGTQRSGEREATVPKPVAKAIQRQWREAVNAGVRYLCIFETCQNCEQHSLTTRHCPGSYQAYRNAAKEDIQKVFPFIHCADLEEQFITPGGPARRIGAFEVYFFCPSDKTSGNRCSSWNHLLLHSKLCTKRWPLIEALLARLSDVLPEVVLRAQSLLNEEWTQIQVEATIREAESWGLGSWITIEELREKVRALRDWREVSEHARATGDTVAMRDAVRRGGSFGGEFSNSETIADLRDNLKKHNMVFLNIKSLAKKFQRNSEFVAAVRLMEASQVRPLKLEVLQETVDKARSAGVADEDLEVVASLYSQVLEVVSCVESGLKDQNLEVLARGLDRGVQLQIKNSFLDAGHREIANASSQLQRATESLDLVELARVLKCWQLPEENAILGAWSQKALAVFLDAEKKRCALQKLVDEAEKRYSACRWDALQKICKERLSNVHVDDEQWKKWMVVLEREHNFTLIKAVSGIGFEFKRRLHAQRLEAILDAKSVPIAQLEDAANTAAMHYVDESRIEKARAEAATARTRLATAQDAAMKKRVDTAEVLFFKLQSGRIRIDELQELSEPLYEMAHAVMVADAVQDHDAMKLAIEGWQEDKPGISHDAFKREDSPTATFRYACTRIKELQVISLRQKLGSLVDSVSKHYGSTCEDPGAALNEIVVVTRELMDLGWDMTTPKRAHLLQLAEIIKAQKTGMDASRFGAMLFRTCASEKMSPRIVFLVDQSGTSTQDFRAHMAPAFALITQEIGKSANANGVHMGMGALAYNPVTKIQELTQSVNTFNDSVSRHTCVKGKTGPVEKALRRAYDVLKDTDPARKDRDSLRIIFNITSSLSENSKEAHKVCVLLESKGIIIVSIAIGSLPSEHVLEDFSSPGLVFRVAEASQLPSFVQDACKSMAQVMVTAGNFSAEDTLKALQSLQTPRA